MDAVGRSRRTFWGGWKAGERCEVEWSFALEHHLELFDLVHVLPEQGVLGVLIDFGFILYELGPAGVSQGAQRLIVVVVGWRNGRNHDSFGIASQRILEQPGQLGIPVGDVMGLAIDQSRDHVAQSTQRQVYFGGLLHALACSARFACPLRPRQIHQIQLRGLVLLVPLLVVLLRVDVDGENAVGAGRFGVHVGRADGSTFEPDFHVFFHFGNGVDLQLQQVLDEKALFGTLLEVHFSLGVPAEQIVNLLVIDFDEAAADEVGLGGVVLGDGDDLAEGARDYPLALVALIGPHHRVRFAATRLPVREDRPVVPVQHVVYQRERRLLVD